MILLERSHTPNYETLNKLLMDKIEEIYGVVQEDALALLKIECICKYCNPKDRIEFEYQEEDGFVNGILLEWLNMDDFRHIQPHLVKFKNLKSLSIRTIERDELIVGIGELENLKRFSIGYSSISDISKIQGLSKLVNLEVLEMTCTKITKIKGLDTLVNLKILNLEENEIAEIEGLENLRNLEELYLGGNPITEIKGLDNLTKLRKLFFFPATLPTDSDTCSVGEIKGLESLINLEELWLMFNDISEIKGLENLVNLRSLCLGHNKIKEIKGLANLGNLTYLDLRWNEISEIQGLEGLEKLKGVNLDCNRISDKKGLYIQDRPLFIYSHFKFPKISFRKKTRKEKKLQTKQSSLKDFFE